MRTALRSVAVSFVTIAVVVFYMGTARADIDNASGTNVQEGDNRASTGQRGGGSSGDSIGGQVSGVVAGGRTSVDARNTSRDSSIESGDVDGSNTARTFTGLNANITGPAA